MDEICSRCDVNKVKYPFMTSLCEKCETELGWRDKHKQNKEQ